MGQLGLCPELTEHASHEETRLSIVSHTQRTDSPVLSKVRPSTTNGSPSIVSFARCAPCRAARSRPPGTSHARYARQNAPRLCPRYATIACRN